MKAITNNKTWRSYTPAEQARIERIVDDNLNEEAILITDKLLKMSCQAITKSKIGGEAECFFFLAAFERIFKEARISVSRGTQDADLDEKMSKIFTKGYPDYFFKSMFENWKIQTKEMGK